MAPRKTAAKAKVVEEVNAIEEIDANEEAKVVEKPKATKKSKANEEVKAKVVEEVKVNEEVKAVDEEVEETTEEESSDEVEKEKKTRKPRVAVTLDDVMEALTALKITEAKAILSKYIKKHGVDGGKTKRTRKSGSDSDEPKKQSEYSIFFSNELKRLSEIENKKSKEDRIPPKDRMRMAAAAWKEHKAAHA